MREKGAKPMLFVDPNSDLFSSGQLCELLQHSPTEICKAAELAGIAPALRLNGVNYFPESAIAQLRNVLQLGTNFLNP
jgi:hypothetical protein